MVVAGIQNAGLSPATARASMTIDSEIQSGARFQFGRNWQKYSAQAGEHSVAEAMASMQQLLDRQDLVGQRLLDAGSGSGLFSAAGCALGAEVVSFDYDPESVACTEQRRVDSGAVPQRWTVLTGSLLDHDFVKGLGQFDVVYCWGVAHHTGDMWNALTNLGEAVRLDGLLSIAIYNDQGKPSRRWLAVKKLYNRHAVLRPLLLAGAFIRLWGVKSLRDILSGRPFHSWRAYGHDYRGMSAWHDLVDWTGGYPFEVAKPEEIFDFYRTRGFTLLAMKTQAGGIGCNEFVFRRNQEHPQP
jgi:2-polyprenyl-6-hydroxyphenyl methylase/3-demethylubiquinone-9 3-methyltransferase